MEPREALRAQAAGVPVAEAPVGSIWTLELEVVGNQLHLALNPGNQGNDTEMGWGTCVHWVGAAVSLSAVKVYSWLLSPHLRGHPTLRLLLLNPEEPTTIPARFSIPTMTSCCSPSRGAIPLLVHIRNATYLGIILFESLGN